MPAPEGFILPSVGQTTNTPGIMKAVSGAIGTQVARFYTHKVYDALASEREGAEIYSERVMLGVKNDRFTEVALVAEGPSDRGDRDGNIVPLRPELNSAQTMATAELYERFKRQQSSTDTPIDNWDAITDGEKAQMRMVDVLFVDQLARFSDDQLYRLGPGAKRLRELAQRHVAGKEKSKSEDLGAEMALILEERKREREAAQAREADLLKQLATLESKPSKKGRVKIEVPKTAGVQEAA